MTLAVLVVSEREIGASLRAQLHRRLIFLFRLGEQNRWRLDLPTEGPARFRMTYGNLPIRQGTLNGWSYQPARAANEWQGDARSNDVLLQILPPEPGYVPPAPPAAPAAVPMQFVY